MVPDRYDAQALVHQLSILPLQMAQTWEAWRGEWLASVLKLCGTTTSHHLNLSACENQASGKPRVSHARCLHYAAMADTKRDYDEEGSFFQYAIVRSAPAVPLSWFKQDAKDSPHMFDHTNNMLPVG
jgi:hypothetical protein